MALLDSGHTMYGPSITGQYLLQPTYGQHRVPHYYRDYELHVQHSVHQHAARLHASPEHYSHELQTRLHMVKEEQVGLHQTAFKPYTSPGQENQSSHANVPSKVGHHRWPQKTVTDDRQGG